MRDHELIERLDRDLLMLERFKTELRHVRADFVCWRDKAAGAQAGGSGRASGVSNPTERDATRRASIGDAYLKRRIRDLTGALELIHDAAQTLDALRKEATRTRTEVPGEPGCVSCARVRVQGEHGKEPLWTPVYDKSRHLCRWCSDWLNDWGVRPCEALVDLHVHQGVKVTNRLISEHMPELRGRLDQRGRRAS